MKNVKIQLINKTDIRHYTSIIRTIFFLTDKLLLISFRSARLGRLFWTCATCDRDFRRVLLACNIRPRNANWKVSHPRKLFLLVLYYILACRLPAVHLHPSRIILWSYHAKLYVFNYFRYNCSIFPMVSDVLSTPLNFFHHGKICLNRKPIVLRRHSKKNKKIT